MIKKIIIAGIIIIGIIFFIRFILGGPEDSWICNKGQWIKHGQPSYTKPSIPCKLKQE